MKEHIINLDQPPEKRWLFLSEYKNEVNALLQCYLNDFEDANSFIFDGIEILKDEIVSTNYLKEIEGIASICDFNAHEILVANLYYDILKFYFGCTAFAVFTDSKMLHARNLDWHTDNNILSRYSKVFDFQKSGKTVFKTIGWPGFVGALSGTRPQHFSITLNAVLSNDQPEIATPISFLLRDVLETCNSFNEAKEMLENTTIASDCLLLLSGTQKHEKVVIERTPTRFATRTTEEDFIVVTNDYKKLENQTVGNSILQATSCGRYDTTSSLLRENKTKTSSDCLRILQDENVMMGITVQQMVFDNASGVIELVCT